MFRQIGVEVLHTWVDLIVSPSASSRQHRHQSFPSVLLTPKSFTPLPMSRVPPATRYKTITDSWLIACTDGFAVASLFVTPQEKRSAIGSFHLAFKSLIRVWKRGCTQKGLEYDLRSDCVLGFYNHGEVLFLKAANRPLLLMVSYTETSKERRQ